MTGADESDDFDVEVGDRVVVRVRENGTSGRVRGKFVGTVKGFRPGVSLTPDRVVISPPWEGMTGDRVVLKPYDAEIDPANGEVNF